MSQQSYTVTEAQEGATLAAILRQNLPEKSWTQVRSLVAQRLVQVDGSLCQDPARRLHKEEIVEVLAKAAPVHRGGTVHDLVIRHLDAEVVVVEKPSGINTVRHPAEREWKQERRELSPTLEDLTQWAISKSLGKPVRDLHRLRIVHRLDKETSGLVVFARSANAERILGKQFHAHTVLRKYVAIVQGHPKSQTITSWLLRDRGDGRRGSGVSSQSGKQAITHVQVEETIGSYSIVSCMLETGRTHQIRIHLAELGFPVCGEPVYRKKLDGSEIPDASQAPRLALHAMELGFQHPDGSTKHWTMELPLDLKGFVTHLKNQAQKRVSMAFTPIVGTLGYVFNEDQTQVLLIHRNKRESDTHFGKYNGLGGKMESGEDIVACMHREILEEAGLYCEELELRGTISWPGFGKDGEDWLGFIFRITKYTGELLQENHEGTLQWVPVEKVESLNLWEGDRFFLPMVFDRNGKSFHGVMPYRNGLPVSWSYTTL